VETSPFKERVTAKHLKKRVLRKAMGRDTRENLYNDKGYRIRCMKSLIRQIQEDCAECNRVWKLVDKGSVNQLEIEELVRVISWVKEGLETLRELRGMDLEGVTWGEMERMERDIKGKESELRMLVYSISMELRNRDFK
jgi:hypothetical protein